MKQRAGASTREDRATIWVVFWFGALWGAAEALAGGLFHLVLPPTYAGRLMLLVAGSLCTYAIRVTGRPGAPLAMAAVAAPLKLLSAAVFGIPVVMPVILNPFFSILSEGAAFALLATWLLRRLAPSPSRFAVFGVSAGALQAPLFIACAVAAGRWLYPSQTEIEALGLAYPAWTLSVAGWLGLLAQMLPLTFLLGGVAAVVGARLPCLKPARLQPALLLSSGLLCLAISLLSAWSI